MSNKIIKQYFALIIVFFSWAHFAHAGFEITEIMYDLDGTDTNREWIEVKNIGTAEDDLSKWFFFSDNTKHALVPQSASMVPAGGYAVITQNATSFRADWPNFSGLLFDSSWSGFSNDGETIALKDPDLNLVSEVTFTSSQGGAGDGNSLQKIGSTWSGATPTPGAENQGGGGGNGGGDTGGGTPPPTATSSSSPVKKKEVEVPKITTNIISQTTVFAGIPFKIDAETFGYSKEPLPRGRFVWNFGDGGTKTEYEHVPFEYTYQYPGQYVLALSYYRVFPGTVVDATDRITIEVIPSQISISSVGIDSDAFVELENKSKLEVNLSKWILKGVIQVFVIPDGTIILPGQKLRFSSRATSLTAADVSSLTLQTPTGQTASTYPTVTRRVVSTNRSSGGSYQPSKTSSPNVIDLNDFGASAANAKGTEVSSSTFAWMGLAGIILIGLASVILMRRRSSRDYIEGNIRAEDMTIME